MRDGLELLGFHSPETKPKKAIDVFRQIDNTKNTNKSSSPAEADMRNFLQEVRKNAVSMIERWKHKDLNSGMKEQRDAIAEFQITKIKGDKEKFQARNIAGHLKIISTMNRLKDINIETLKVDSVSTVKPAYQVLQEKISSYFQKPSEAKTIKAEIQTIVEEIEKAVKYRQPQIPKNHRKLSESGKFKTDGDTSVDLFKDGDKSKIETFLKANPDMAIVLPDGITWIQAKDIDLDKTMKTAVAPDDKTKAVKKLCLNANLHGYSIGLSDMVSRSDAEIPERERTLIAATRTLMSNRLQDLTKAMKTDDEFSIYSAMGEIQRAGATLEAMTDIIKDQRAKTDDPDSELQKIALEKLSFKRPEEIQIARHGNPILQTTHKLIRFETHELGRQLVTFLTSKAPNFGKRLFTSPRIEAYKELDQMVQRKNPWRLERVDHYPDHTKDAIDNHLSDTNTLFRANNTAVHLLLPETCATPYFSSEDCPRYNNNCSKNASYQTRALHALEIGGAPTLTDLERTQRKNAIKALKVPDYPHLQLRYAVEVSNIIAGRPTHTNLVGATTLREPDTHATEKEKMAYTVKVANLIHGRDIDWGVSVIPDTVDAPPTGADTRQHVDRFVYLTKIRNILNGEENPGHTPNPNAHIEEVKWIAMNHFTDGNYSTNDARRNQRRTLEADPAGLDNTPVGTSTQARLAFKLRISLELQGKTAGQIRTQIQRLNSLDTDDITDTRPHDQRRKPEVIKAMNSDMGKSLVYAERISKLLQGKDVLDDDDVSNIHPMFINQYYLSKTLHANLEGKTLADTMTQIDGYRTHLQILDTTKIAKTETPAVRASKEMENAVIRAQNQSINALNVIFANYKQNEDDPSIGTSVRLSLMEIGRGQKKADKLINLTLQSLNEQDSKQRENSEAMLRSAVRETKEEATYKVSNPDEELMERRKKLIEEIDQHQKIDSASDVSKRFYAIKELVLIEQKLYFRKLQETDPTAAQRMMDSWHSNTQALEQEMQKKLDRENTRAFIEEFTTKQFKRSMWLYAVMSAGSFGNGIVNTIDGVSDSAGRALREVMRDLTK